MRHMRHTKSDPGPLALSIGVVGVGILFGALGLAGVAGCGEGKVDKAADAVTFALDLEGTGGKIVLDRVGWLVKGSDGAQRKGEADLSSSTRPQFVIGGFAAGTYTITVTGTASDGVTVCSGASAVFAITTGVTTPIILPLTCKQPKRNGSVSVNGRLNVCARVEDPSASPGEVVVGGSIAVDVGEISDPDQGPAALTGEWTATPAIGVFGDRTAPSTTFRCARSGAVALKFTASDGDPGCESSGKVTVVCTSTCPAADGDPCTLDTCMPDGSTSHVPSDWQGCPAAAAAIGQICPERMGPITDAEIPLLDRCSETLGKGVAKGGDLNSLSAEFVACMRVALGCSSPVEASVRQALSLSNGGGVCNQAGYQSCATTALETFLVTASSCSAAAAGTVLIPPLSFPGAAGAYALCILAAIVAEDLMIRLCVSRNSCTGSQMCVQGMCVDAGIKVTSASYGHGSCGNALGNVTGTVAAGCDGKIDCDVFVSNSVFGDPSYGCAKDFDVVYMCGLVDRRTARHGAVAGEGYTVPLTCR